MKTAFIFLLFALAAVHAHQVTSFETRRRLGMNLKDLTKKMMAKAKGYLMKKGVDFAKCMKGALMGKVIKLNFATVASSLLPKRRLGFSLKKLVKKGMNMACKAGGLENKGKAACVKIAQKGVKAAGKKCGDLAKKMPAFKTTAAAVGKAAEKCSLDVAKSVCADVAKAACSGKRM
jgi:hypothetical protein